MAPRDTQTGRAADKDEIAELVVTIGKLLATSEDRDQRSLHDLPGFPHVRRGCHQSLAAAPHLPKRYADGSSPDIYRDGLPRLQHVCETARKYLLGGHISPGDQDAYDAPVLQGEGAGYTIGVAIPAYDPWADYQPSAEPLRDWALLAGHLQRLHAELAGKALTGQPTKPTITRIAAMADAVRKVAHRLKTIVRGKTPLIIQRRVLLIGGPSDGGGSMAVSEIQAFLDQHADTSTEPKVSAVKGKPDVFRLTTKEVGFFEASDMTGSLTNDRVGLDHKRHPIILPVSELQAYDW